MYMCRETHGGYSRCPGTAQKMSVSATETAATKTVTHIARPSSSFLTYGSRGWLAMLLGDRFGSGTHASTDDHNHSHDQNQSHEQAQVQRETKHWQEGWYLWWSSSRWAAQEKLDLMRRDLEGQSDWQRLKDKRNDEWARGVQPGLEEQGQHGDGQPHDLHPFEDLGNAPPFPDVT